MYKKEIDLLRTKIKQHTFVSIALIILLLATANVNKYFIYVNIGLFLVHEGIFNFHTLRCPQCKKLLRNPFIPRIMVLPDKCPHCGLKII